MFSIFKQQKRKQTPDFSVLHTDMHSHLIPGIDDGAPDLDTAVDLVKSLKQLGFKKIITTPHVMADLYPNSSDTIKQGLAELKKGLAAANIKIDIAVAAEYLIDEGFEALLEADDLLPVSGNRILIEMSFINPAPNLKTILFNLQTAGYIPIMAHPERYQYYFNDFSNFERLIDRGCELQVNLLSLTGYYGNPIKKMANKLIKANMVSYLGTDLHNHKHLEQMEEYLGSPLAQIEKKYTFKNHTL